MIRFLPTPYPDELLWSVFARAARRMRMPSHGATAKSLLGSRNATAVLDLPSGLDQFCAQIGMEHGNLDSDKIIASCTLLPFYAPFLGQDQLQQIHADMRADGRGMAIRLKAGIMASRVRTPAQMHYCPRCKAEDTDLYGESYWRRTHQAPGVEVCPHHAVFLEPSCVQRTNRRTRHAYAPVPGPEQSQVIKNVNLNDPEHVVLLQIARDAYWLLNDNRIWAQTENLRRVYRNELCECNLAIHNGRVRLATLNEELSGRYSAALLARLQCGPSADGFLRWLPRLLRSRRAAQAPIYHLLFANFLRTNIRRLFSKLNDPGGFGSGAWPCLNPVCTQYQLAVIQRCKTGHDHKGALLGTFRCMECGYTYVRRGPDRNGMARERIAWVLEYGPRWEDDLKCCWANQKLSLRGMARRLRVDPLTIKRIALKLSLSFPRPGKRCVHREPDRKFHAAKTKKPTDQANCRGEWQALIHQHPKLSRSELRRLLPAVYMWLYRHDRDWLMKEALLSRRTAIQSSKAIKSLSTQNWITRDACESVRVYPLVKQILNGPGRPERMSKADLARRLGILAWVQKHAARLPLTIAALEAFSETRESFALRRITYALATAKWRAGLPRKWRLLRLAGIREEVAVHPVVQRRINQALVQAQHEIVNGL